MQGHGIALGIAAQQARLPGVGVQQPKQNMDGCGLPGAVRAGETVYLAGANGHVKTVQSARSAKHLDQAGHRDCICHARDCSLFQGECDTPLRLTPGCAETVPARLPGRDPHIALERAMNGFSQQLGNFLIWKR